ncbi:Nitric oxide-dependent regulator DnrN or NorA [Lunatimonas lonarensis]|uniref:Nitric oxide-dependent regulator DnrN or NorA n=1 Tax=Lunatimonas lonarensis TaxID=1232681 RepID=R7ZUA5_9BACT|nr:hemerythrin domain-containing protein [Lunatimonas lonarensis]EON77647.1 Nitric oxide-dependent regulator DnrN or NorA [Lunatimonas lonarensis]
MASSSDIYKKSIGDLVSENHVFAAVLHYFGISFFQFESDSLEDVCRKFKVSPSQVVAELESWAKSPDPSTEELYLHPIEVLVGYLKKKHRYFMRQELPFLSTMVAGITSNPSFDSLLADLRLLFPLFADDFIHHIHEEEDTLFERIRFLQEIERNNLPLQKALMVFEMASIMDLAEEHEAHDDEMEGIRKLTANYSLKKDAPIAIRVLYHELQKLEQELIIHAKIENDLLFPKAVELEKEVKRSLLQKIKSN